METVRNLAARLAPWLRQTSTILGISTLLGLLVSVLTGELTWAAALPIAVGAVVSMALPGQTAASTVAGQIAMDVVVAANPATRTQGLKSLSRDLPNIVTVLPDTPKGGSPG